MADRVGHQLGNYRLARLLGRGGFADVYLGQHVHLASKQAAIKLLHLFDVDVQKFQQEAETTEQLVHPHIVRLLDFDFEQGTSFLVLDFAPGGSLRTRHPKGSQLPLVTVVAYLTQVAPALQYAHDQQILHRDIKPENMLIGRQEELLLSDFGIAVLSQTGRTSVQNYNVGGTPFYMAPEQYQGKPEKASDQYALAVVVYEWLCGTVPFREGNFIQLGYQHTHEPVPPLREKMPSIPSEVEMVVMKALAKDPKERFDSVSAFANAIGQASQSQQPEPVSETTGTSQSQQSTGLAPPVIPFSQQVTTGDIPAQMSSQQARAAEVSTNPSSPQTTSEVSASMPAQPQNIPPWSRNERAAPATVPVPSPSPQQDGFPLVEGKSEAAQRGVSRRTVVLGLGLAGLVVAGGGIAWLVSSQGQHSSLAPSQTPASPSSTSPLYTYRGHYGGVNAVAWSPNGTRIASGSDDITVQVWDAADGGHVYTYRGHSNPVSAVAWSPNGMHIASASYDRTVQIWEAV